MSKFTFLQAVTAILIVLKLTNLIDTDWSLLFLPLVIWEVVVPILLLAGSCLLIVASIIGGIVLFIVGGICNLIMKWLR